MAKKKKKKTSSVPVDNGSMMDEEVAKVLASIQKDFGKDSIMCMGETPEAIPSTSSGCISLDFALGGGGYPHGRIIELFGVEAGGKTTLALHAVASFQKAGRNAAFIDAEHALNPAWAEQLGVDTDKLVISQPNSGEEALNICKKLVESGAFGVIVIDSVAALVPQAELNGDIGDTHVAVLARLMSGALRQLAAKAQQSNTTVIFINQIREKVGVMFGCFHYSTRVTLADGSQEKIGKIVNQKLPVKVLSYDYETKQVVPRKIVGWYDNGPSEGFLSFTVEKPGRNGRAQFSCTPNHKIMTPTGWKEAKTLKAGDRVMQETSDPLSPTQWSLIRGSLMGDGALSLSDNGYSAKFRWGHGAKQIPYSQWKADMFQNLPVSCSENSKGGLSCDVAAIVALGSLRKEVYQNEQKNFSQQYFDALTPLALAVWYMDDGHFDFRTEGKQTRTEGGSGRIQICVEKMTPESRVRLCRTLFSKWDIESRVGMNGGKAVLQIGADATKNFQKLVAPYIHPSMDYKLLPRFRGQFSVKAEFVEPTRKLMDFAITDIREKPASRNTHRFDIEVEDTHNYFVDGVMVHNSPETTPGGRALKFYSSVRVDIRRIGQIKDGDQVVGSRTKAKVVKNKVAPPFRQAEFDIVYTEGISYAGDLLDLGLQYGIIDKAGAWYSYGETRIGHGRENAKEYIRENPEDSAEIEKKIREAYWDANPTTKRRNVPKSGENEAETPSTEPEPEMTE